jgi:LPXTG-motif cell wall-anchored protein
MRLMPSRRSSVLLAAVSAAAAITFSFATTAAAAEPERFEGNIEWNWDNACSVGGLTGTSYTEDKFTFTGGKDTQSLNITAAPAGVTITGVVVKGSNAYYVYLADDLGTLPWNGLKAPVNKGGNVADISHWYACGVKDQTPSSSVTPSSTSPSTITHTAPPSSSETTTTSSSEVAATTTTTAAAAPGSNDLASTGFGSAWLVGLGAALLAAGVAVLFVLRRRRA